MRTLSRLVWATSFVLALAACGGGGGSAEEPAARAEPTVSIRATALAVSTDSTVAVQTVLGGTVSLDGSGSRPGSGTLSTYAWTVVTRPASSTAQISNASSATASFAPDAAGSYALNLRVTDSNGGTANTSVAATVGGAPAVPNVVTAVSFNGPINSLPTQGTLVGAAVTLDATSSADPAGGALTLTWTVLSKPTGSTAALTVNGTRASLTPDLVGSYQVRVRATTSAGNYADAVHTYSVTDAAPRVLVSGTVTASASNGSALAAAVGNVVSLQGYDISGFTFNLSNPVWTFVTKPYASNLGPLTGSYPFQVNFVPDVAGAYVVQLSAKEGLTGRTSFYTVTVNVAQGPRVVVAASASPAAAVNGPSFVAASGQPVTLRGGASTDPAGGTLSFQWRVVSAPTGSAAALTSAGSVNTDITPDRVGRYELELAVTASGGLSDTQTFTLLVGTTLPTARVDSGTVSVLTGRSASVSAAGSTTQSGNTLSYSWALDSRPAGSTATISNSTAAALAFTPDVAGTYYATVTVSDGPLTAIAPVSIVALSPSAGVFPLNYAPVLSRYNKLLGKVVIATSNPNALHLVDPAAGTDETIVLPAAAKALSITPDGRYAGVLHENTVTLVDLGARTVLRSFFSQGPKSDIALNNALVVYLLGNVTGSFSSNLGYTVLDGATGNVAQTASLNLYSGYVARMVYSELTSKLFAAAENYSSNGLSATVVDPVNFQLGATSNISYNYSATAPLWLSGSQDYVFTSEGAIYKTSDLSFVGNLGARFNAFSHSASAAEAVALVASPNNGNLPSYPAAYKRYTTALFFATADVPLPMVDGGQSYGINIFHRADDRKIVLVQTGDDKVVALGLKYYLLVR